MRAFLLSGLRAAVISRAGEVAAAWVDEAVQRKKPSAGELTACYVDVVRKFLVLDSNEAVYGLFGEYYVGHFMAAKRRDAAGPEAVVGAVEELNAVQARLQADFPTVDFITFAAHVSGPEVVATCTSGCPPGDSELHAVARGMLVGLGRQFAPQGSCEVRDGEAGAMHVRIRRKSVVDPDALFSSVFAIQGADIDRLFPFHIAFDRGLVVRQAGSRLCTLLPYAAVAPGTPLLAHFRLTSPPGIALTAEDLMDHADLVYMLEATSNNANAVDGEDQPRPQLHGQIVYIAAADLFVFLCTPTMRTLAASDCSMLDIPVMCRLLDLPANLHITEVPIPIHGAIEPTAALGVAGEGGGEVIPKAKVLLSLPPRDAVHPHTNTPAAPKPEPADIMVLRIEKSGGLADDAGGVGVDMSSPVQKILAALQGLRGQVATGLRDQIDAIMRELTQSPDVYVPSLAGKLVKADKEVNNYMASFLPRQSTVKFNIQPRINRSLSMAARRHNTLVATRSSGLTPSASSMSVRGPTPPGAGAGAVAGAGAGTGVCTVGSMPQATKTGWLNKESSANARAWRLRYFVLNGQYLYYYRSDALDASPLGIINLAEYTHIAQVTRKSALCIQLSHADEPAPGTTDEAPEDHRRYYLYADVPADTKAWADAIADAYAELKLGAESQAWRRLVAPLEHEHEQGEDGEEGGGKGKQRSRSIVGTEAVRILIPRQSVGGGVAWLERLDQLDFNVFELAHATNDRPLQYLAKALLLKTGLLDKFAVPEHKLDNFLRVINRGYRKDNAYHNAYHAADVTQTLYYFLYTLGVAQYLGDRECFAALLAAIIHDFMHPGLNNAYMIATRAPEAMLYNDQSVLENMHLTKAFQVLQDDDCNIFAGLSGDDYRHIRMLIIQMVLNTDMSQHFELMGKFKSAVILMADKPTAEIQPATILLILSMAIHCADVSNPCKPTPLYREWAQRVMSEFWHQGDLERAAGMPISPMCDRHTVTLEKCQSSFMDFIVEPLYMTFAELVPELHDECIANLHTNKAYFRGMITEQAETQPAADP